jgi:hypothetical protein
LHAQSIAEMQIEFQHAIEQQLLPRKQARLTFYVPKALPRENATAKHIALQKLREQYAQALFQLAKPEMEAGRWQQAAPWLHEVLHAMPTHSEALKIIPLQQTTRPVAKAIPQTHQQFGWRQGRHWRIETAHFLIETNHSSKLGIELAQTLEQYFAVWQQMFPLVSQAQQKLRERTPNTKFRVVMFQSQEEYIRQLAQNKNIALSKGIYVEAMRTSMFFAGDKSLESTWIHEVTHQLFQESWQAKVGVGTESRMWLYEAMALFMESYKHCGEYATVGGWDADNLQFARFRALGGDFYLPLEKLDTLNRETLQQHTDIRRIYSEMSGLGHYFMQSKTRAAFESAFHDLHLQPLNAASLAERTQVSFAEHDRLYLEFLQLTDATIQANSPSVDLTKVCFRNTQVTNSACTHFKHCTQLEWIDCTHTKIDDLGVQCFPPGNKLKQCFLEQTPITDAALLHLSQFRELQELYVSHTKISDTGLKHLQTLNKLQILDVSSCPITEASLEIIRRWPQLRELHALNTNISASAWKNLQKQRPQLKIILE